MGLGSAGSVPLAKARELAAACRSELPAGRNPLQQRQDQQKAQRVAQGSRKTFGEVADDFIASKSLEWRNAKHLAQWKMTLDVYAGPLRSMPVAEITTEHILAVMQPIWLEKPETASRTRGRIEAVLDAARTRGLIHENAANPARWRGHLDHLLPKRQKLTRGHHAAMLFDDVPAFVARLRKRDAMAALAVEFTILTAARSGEVLGATWSEIDLKGGVWTLPPARMKASRQHRVPLSARALEILHELYANRVSEFVFPGQKPNRPLSPTAMQMVLRRMGVTDITVHGFRSSFRDWCGEMTDSPREVAEAALAHVSGDATERAYRRGDALEKRRELMQRWADWLYPPSDSDTKKHDDGQHCPSLRLGGLAAVGHAIDNSELKLRNSCPTGLDGDRLQEELISPAIALGQEQFQVGPIQNKRSRPKGSLKTVGTKGEEAALYVIEDRCTKYGIARNTVTNTVAKFLAETGEWQAHPRTSKAA